MVSSNGCTQATNIPAPALAWRFASELWSDITAGSGSNRNPEEAPLSSSPSPSDTGATGKRRQILVVEDNRADVFLIREAIRVARVNAELHVVSDGEKAIRFFNEVDADPALPCPDVVLLDINLPRRQGGEVLEEMRRSRRCSRALVMVVTSSDSDADRQRMASLGADEYFRKSSEYRDFMQLGEVVKTLLGRAKFSQ